MRQTTNRLVSEPSLYLRQHAHNPVDWYPWGDEALARARAEDKPIFLSIGYSSCHWCHVMERESFENEEIARLLNRSFVCIKVDREERPDLDAIYMKTVQLLTGRGGWPMTVFLSPDLRPFYAGTYFPPEDRGGMPGLPRVLDAVVRAYAEERDKLVHNGARIVEMLEGDGPHGSGVAPFTSESAARIAEAGRMLVRSMDAEFGGFGRAPKFPPTASLELLMQLDARTSEPERRRLIELTLDRMADGGIYDHLGGGFHRYSVDREWLVPHFEKMLYDQANLAGLYVDAWSAFDSSRYMETAAGVLDFVVRELCGEEGAFYASQDADSEGEEGLFYLWDADEIRDVGGAEAATLICTLYGVSDAGNFEGRNILHRTMTLEEAAGFVGLSADEAARRVKRGLSRLYGRREQRPRPATDRKILADWNGLMIGAMALGGRRMGREDLVDAALRAIDFIRARMTQEQRLLHFYAEGVARVAGMLDDYAFFGRGCLEAFFARGRREDFESACASAKQILGHFEDPQRGGFFSTPDDSRELILRPRDLFDGAVPSGYSVATELLLRLHQLTGDDEYRRAGEAALSAGMETASANPHACAHLLCTADRYLRGFAAVVIAPGAAALDDARALTESALTTFAPELSVLRLPARVPEWMPSVAQGKGAVGGRATAFLCRGQTCEPPCFEVPELATALRRNGT